MRTTMLIIEFLVAGILVSVALLLCGVSFFPDQTSAIIENFSSVPVSVQVLLGTIFVSIAYGVGIFSEYVGLSIFEGQLDRIKGKRMIKYLKDLKDEKVDLEKSCILKKFKEIPPEKITKKQAKSCIGPMRFYVLRESSSLYQDIASQIHRLRLIRILFLVEIILIAAVFGQLIQRFSPYMIGVLVFLIAVAVVNYKAIMSRFNRYCRAIERSYKVLVFH